MGVAPQEFGIDRVWKRIGRSKPVRVGLTLIGLGGITVGTAGCEAKPSPPPIVRPTPADIRRQTTPDVPLVPATPTATVVEAIGGLEFLDPERRTVVQRTLEEQAKRAEAYYNAGHQYKRIKDGLAVKASIRKEVIQSLEAVVLAEAIDLDTNRPLNYGLWYDRPGMYNWFTEYWPANPNEPNPGFPQWDEQRRTIKYVTKDGKIVAWVDLGRNRIIDGDFPTPTRPPTAIREPTKAPTQTPTPEATATPAEVGDPRKGKPDIYGVETNNPYHAKATEYRFNRQTVPSGKGGSYQGLYRFGVEYLPDRPEDPNSWTYPVGRVRSVYRDQAKGLHVILDTSNDDIGAGEGRYKLGSAVVWVNNGVLDITLPPRINVYLTRSFFTDLGLKITDVNTEDLIGSLPDKAIVRFRIRSRKDLGNDQLLQIYRGGTFPRETILTGNPYAIELAGIEYDSPMQGP